LELTGPGGSHTIREETRSSGSYDETFDLPNLSIGEYTKVKATWTVGGAPCIDEYDYHIKVLGAYDHTCYNTPDESGCTGSLEWFSYVIANPVNPCGPAPPCNWINAQGKSGWLNAIFDPKAGTGSGKDVSKYIYSREWYCTGSDYPRRLRRTGCACGSCEYDCISVGDVAINSGNEDLECGETVCVHQHGTHTVRDTGDLAMDQLDHYYGVSDCGYCPSIGDDIMTIKVY